LTPCTSAALLERKPHRKFSLILIRRHTSGDAGGHAYGKMPLNC
jgi:hypothetical protein